MSRDGGPHGAGPHDAETAAAAYLGGAMNPRQRREHEQHLLACDGCWTEVDLGRRGRILAEDARELVPAGLLERVRAEVGAAAAATPTPQSSRRPSRRRVLTLAAGVLAVVAAVGAVDAGRAVLFSPAERGTSLAAGSTSVVEAVARFREGRLPGDGTPSLPVPDLATVGLHPVGAATGELGGESVTGFAYADDTGRRVVVYLGDNPFPRVGGAEQIRGADGPWIARTDGVVLLCARLPHAMLLVGEDAALVRSAAVELDAI